MPRFFAALLGLTASTAVAGRFGGFLIDSKWFPVCIFRSVTSRPCIFCGMSHAVVYAMRGDWAMASHANPAWWLILPLFLVLTAGIMSGRSRLGWPIVIVVIAGTIVRAWV
jgi:hypothetical protein